MPFIQRHATISQFEHFLRDVLVPSRGGRVQATELYNLYKSYAKANDWPIASQKVFGEFMTQAGYERKYNRIGTYYTGIDYNVRALQVASA